ncbi:GNAT family N-acetyltransferase [Janthinobacterium agaricidamnosum]|uniref:Acetyltransferase family protein n=1 Tax=Janthinobacterium agaricidamnosum NBRC 102515 = DSM 9628 TaxID=1349767 RepID=W0VCG6_9BURK|nr:GNAT family N-acetyltransferase [Janthinobacterium agaricidamnosum]CDG84982.1 acetyltransferase family protein [Janthinobacterium agaricidamnosum NBRC 102515 = DSM 9628]
MYIIRPMLIEDYDAVMDLMRNTPGISLRDADSRAATRRYLDRNPQLSFVAELGGRTVACIMSGHDGRRGYLQHLVVLPEHRRLGIASALVEKCLAALEGLGIAKVHLDVIKGNQQAHAYWQRQGWKLRTDIDRYSLLRCGGENA